MAWSGQEQIAFQTGYQDGIYGRPQANPYSVVRSRQAYDEGWTEGQGSTTPPRGPAGPQGEKGDPGSRGAPGISGNNGTNGLSFHSGVGVPAPAATRRR